MDERRWRYATYAVIGIWVVFAIRLMIADVWDETNGMLAFSSAAMTLGQKLEFVLAKSLGFWRPLPTLVVTLVLHFVTDFDVSWRILRFVNLALLVGALAVLMNTSKAVWTERFIFAIAFLFSGSAVITAGWYANIFDASVLLLVAIGLSLLLLRGKDLAAGVVFGVAFFCKESAALVLPFLLVLLAARRITFKQALRAGIPAAILGAVYFFIRSKIVPFGGEGDIHGFAPQYLMPTFVNLAESFWEQTLKSRGFLGFFWLALSLAALKKPRLIAATLLFFSATAVIYWGMFNEYQNGVLVHHLDFIGRLYLVPVTLVLFLLAIERRTLAMALLLLPIVFGGMVTWRDHARFQRMYKRIYSTAMRGSVTPLTVHFPPKPLEDTVRGVKIGDIPDASVTINAETGRLSYR
ncbi:MAG TPA: hypothetical protein VE974_09610 [Thermoanaerobaculia bacterium]|nr:hypothetical protein [Thermoanaerobaculia bacterium]